MNDEKRKEMTDRAGDALCAAFKAAVPEANQFIILFRVPGEQDTFLTSNIGTDSVALAPVLCSTGAQIMADFIREAMMLAADKEGVKWPD